MTKPNHLTTIRLFETDYFVDNRLQQLRNVQDPHDFMEFSEFETMIQLATLSVRHSGGAEAHPELTKSSTHKPKLLTKPPAGAPPRRNEICSKPSRHPNRRNENQESYACKRTPSASTAFSLLPLSGTIPAFRRHGVRTPNRHTVQTHKLRFLPNLTRSAITQLISSVDHHLRLALSPPRPHAHAFTASNVLNGEKGHTVLKTYLNDRVVERRAALYMTCGKGCGGGTAPPAKTTLRLTQRRLGITPSHTRKRCRTQASFSPWEQASLLGPRWPQNRVPRPLASNALACPSVPGGSKT